jgi:DNA repair exonuclease SbcCD ATPase subunit
MDEQRELLKALFKEQIQTEIDLLSQRVKAEQETARAEQETASELRRKNDLQAKTLQVESQRNRLWLEISERTANIVQQLPELARVIYGYDEKLEQFPELIEELEERLDRIERAIVLLLSPEGKGSRQAKVITKGIEQDQQKRLIEQLKRRLEKLETKRAQYGIDTPAHLLLEIEDLKDEIKQLEG